MVISLKFGIMEKVLFVYQGLVEIFNQQVLNKKMFLNVKTIKKSFTGISSVVDGKRIRLIENTNVKRKTESQVVH